VRSSLTGLAQKINRDDSSEGRNSRLLPLLANIGELDLFTAGRS
jgi:hypothetical protein